MPEMTKNECADTLAKYQARHGNSLFAEATIRTAGPDGNLLLDFRWLAVEDVNQQGSDTEAPQHGTRFTYLPNLKPHRNPTCTRTIG